MSRRTSYSSIERMSMYAKSSGDSTFPTAAANPARTPSPGNKDITSVSPTSIFWSRASSSSSLDNSNAAFSIPEDDTIGGSSPTRSIVTHDDGSAVEMRVSPTLRTFLGSTSTSKLKVRRTSSLARLERAALLPATAASADRRCTDCQEPYDAFGNILYKCARCDNDFCHMCVPQRPQQNSYVRLCLQCYKNIRGITRIRTLGEGGAEALLAPSALGQAHKDAVIAGFEEGLVQIRQQQRFDAQESSDLCYMLSLKMSSTLTKNRKESVAQALALSPDQRLAEEIAIYVVLPVNILDPLVAYFQAEEDREVQQLSRWYDAKKRRLEEKIQELERIQAPPVPSNDAQTAVPTVPKNHASNSTVTSSPGTVMSSPGTVTSSPGTVMSSLGTLTSSPGTVTSPLGTVNSSTISGSAGDGGPYVVSDADGSGYLWLHPDLSRREAEEIICSVGVEGAWLVRRVVNMDDGAREHVELVVNHGGTSGACHVITRSARSRALRVGTVQVLHRGGLPELITALSNPPNDTTTRTGITLDSSLAVSVKDVAAFEAQHEDVCPHKTCTSVQKPNSPSQVTPPWLHRAVPRESVLEVLLEQGITGAWLVHTPSRVGVPDDIAEIMVDTGGSVPVAFQLERDRGVPAAVYRVVGSNGDTGVLQHVDGKYDSIVGIARALTEETAGVPAVLDPAKFVRQTASRDVIGDILNGNTDFRYDEV